VSLIIAPHVRQIDSVGARSRLQTGHIIGVVEISGFGGQRLGQIAERISEITLRRQQ
jgi:hypothetical protein